MFDKLYPRDQIKNYLLIDLVTTVFFFFLVLRSNTALGLSGSLFLLLAYAAAFYIGLWRRDRYLLGAVLAGLAVLTIIAGFIGFNMLMFGFIFSDLLGRSKSKAQIGIGMAAIALMFVLVSWIRADSLAEPEHLFLLPLAVIQLALPVVIYIKEKAKSLQGELDAANRQLEHYIQQEERQRIARDLHDTLGQTLTMIKLKSELTARWIDKDAAQAKKELNDILASSRTALKQVRELVSEMKFVSLTGELAQARQLLQAAGIELAVEEQGQAPLLSSVEETMIALCVREAVTNMVKHSQADRCSIRLEASDGGYAVYMADNGIGLDRRRNAGGNGLQSMKERMSALGGTFSAEAAAGGGTIISLKLPLRGQRKE